VEADAGFLAWIALNRRGITVLIPGTGFDPGLEGSAAASRTLWQPGGWVLLSGNWGYLVESADEKFGLVFHPDGPAALASVEQLP
jgi:hypothetical protein